MGGARRGVLGKGLTGRDARLRKAHARKAGHNAPLRMAQAATTRGTGRRKRARPAEEFKIMFNDKKI